VLNAGEVCAIARTSMYVDQWPDPAMRYDLEDLVTERAPSGRLASDALLLQSGIDALAKVQ